MADEIPVLLVQSDRQAAQALAAYFLRLDTPVLWADTPTQARELAAQHHPDLVFLDLHLPEDGCLVTLSLLAELPDQPRVIITNRHPDLDKELRLKKYQTAGFLRQPFTDHWIEAALERVSSTDEGKGTLLLERSNLETSILRTPVRLKITLPYILLATVLAVVAVFIASRVILDSLEKRYLNQLVEAGKLTNDWIVFEENRRLETLRSLANTRDLPAALQNQDGELLRELALPIIVNAQEEDVHFLDMNGVSVLTVRHTPGGSVEDYQATQGETFFKDLYFVQRALRGDRDQRGDKFAGIANTPWGDYIYIVGPVFYGRTQVGVVVVGRSLQNLAFSARESLLGRNNTFAHINIYALSGKILASTLPEINTLNLDEDLAKRVLDTQTYESQLRNFSLASLEYTEILSPLQLRSGSDHGLLGTAIVRQFIIQSTDATRTQIFIFAAVGLVLVITTGTLIANWITKRLDRVVDAAIELADGNLDVRVEPQGTDELALLSHSFNYMVSNIREGVIYRDLLSKTITPQVREQLRQNFIRGELRMEGQSFIATILITDVRDFTAIAENLAPTQVMETLNEYYGVIVPFINELDGVISEYVGDGLMAYFGVLPTPLPPETSAYNACKAAIEMIDAINQLNQERIKRGDRPLITGIGINTGPVAAGNLGVSERMHYAIIGDTVNSTSRLEELTKSIGATSAVIGGATLAALGEKAEEFNITYFSEEQLRGRSQPLQVYRLERLREAEAKPRKTHRNRSGSPLTPA